jgi:glyoxylase-like metal-dependent hydrolase (beta-lactamase superfamily II)
VATKESEREMMKLGDVELISILENKFKVDAGSMFGIIPKVIWGRMVEADDLNRIVLDLNPLLIKTSEQIIIVDTGFGDVMTEKQNTMFGLDKATAWDDELTKHGIRPEQVTAVIFTHLHADHALGALRKSADGTPELRFPNARLYAQKREWQDAINPNERTTATYHVDKLRLFEESGKLELLDGDTDLFPNVSVKALGGHTPGMQGVIIDSNGERVIYPGDLLPMTYNIKIPYVAAVDLDPTTTMNQKRWLHERMLKDDWILAFDHDIEFKFAKFVSDDKGKIKAVNYPG